MGLKDSYRFRRRKKLVVYSLTVLICIYLLYSNLHVLRALVIYSIYPEENFLNPPKVNEEELILIRNLIKERDKVNRTLGLEQISQVVQNQIKDIQELGDCNGPTLLCGHFKTDCGFGCWLHHSVACLMMSYALRLPLIHETEMPGSKWSYSTPWTDVLRPLGSKCKVTDKTYTWSFNHWQRYYKQSYDNSEFSWQLKYSKIPYKLGHPLFGGIVVSGPLAELVEELSPDPFVWSAGQFVKYTFQLQPETKKRIFADQESIGFRPDCIGIHVRRTDKFEDELELYHEVGEYILKAEEMLRQLETGAPFGNKKPQIFLASDDVSLLPAAQEKYKSWDIIGFEGKKTLRNPRERRGSLYEIIRDVVTLSQCKRVICGFSSNVCTLLLEMKAAHTSEEDEAVINVDKKPYSFSIFGGMSKRINRI